MKFIKLNCLKLKHHEWYEYDSVFILNVDCIKCIKKSRYNLASNVSEKNEEYERLENINLYEPFSEVQILLNNGIEKLIVAESVEQIYEMLNS